MTNQDPEDQRSASLRKKQKYIHNHNTHIIILSCKFIKEIFLYLTRGGGGGYLWHDRQTMCRVRRRRRGKKAQRSKDD